MLKARRDLRLLDHNQRCLWSSGRRSLLAVNKTGVLTGETDWVGPVVESPSWLSTGQIVYLVRLWTTGGPLPAVPRTSIGSRPFLPPSPPAAGSPRPALLKRERRIKKLFIYVCIYIYIYVYTYMLPPLL